MKLRKNNNSFYLKLLFATILTVVVFNSHSQTIITKGAGKTHTVRLKSGNSSGATFSWAVTPSSGTSTDLNLVSGNSASIIWDGAPGLYTISVQVTDGNGCLSEAISQNIEVLAPGIVAFSNAFTETITCSALAGEIAGSASGSSESLFRIVYSGNANLNWAKVTIKNPDELYIDKNGNVLADQSNPFVFITNVENDKEIDFSVSDLWENTTSGNLEYQIALVSVLTLDNSEINAEPANDISRKITVLPKPFIEFE